VLNWTGPFWQSVVTLQKSWWWLWWCKVGEILSLPVIHCLTIKKGWMNLWGRWRGVFVDRGTVNGRRQIQERLEKQQDQNKQTACVFQRAEPPIASLKQLFITFLTPQSVSHTNTHTAWGVVLNIQVYLGVCINTCIALWGCFRANGPGATQEVKQMEAGGNESEVLLTAGFCLSARTCSHSAQKHVLFTS